MLPPGTFVTPAHSNMLNLSVAATDDLVHRNALVMQEEISGIPVLMKALHYSSDGLRFIERNIMETPLSENEVLVQVLRAGICKTDLEIIRGYANMEGILGHEFVGLVILAGSAAQNWIGSRSECQWCTRSHR